MVSEDSDETPAFETMHAIDATWLNAYFGLDSGRVILENLTPDTSHCCACQFVVLTSHNTWCARWSKGVLDGSHPNWRSRVVTAAYFRLLASRTTRLFVI